MSRAWTWRPMRLCLYVCVGMRVPARVNVPLVVQKRYRCTLHFLTITYYKRVTKIIAKPTLWDHLPTYVVSPWKPIIKVTQTQHQIQTRPLQHFKHSIGQNGELVVIRYNMTDKVGLLGDALIRYVIITSTPLYVCVCVCMCVCVF